MADCVLRARGVCISVIQPLSAMMRFSFLLLSVSLLFGRVVAADSPPPPLTIAITDRELTDARRTREITKLFEEAVTAKAPLLVLDINSSGVNPETALAFAEQIARLKIRTVAYVNPAAVAGGALVALGCDEIWMAPGARIGASGWFHDASRPPSRCVRHFHSAHGALSAGASVRPAHTTRATTAGPAGRQGTFNNTNEEHDA